MDKRRRGYNSGQRACGGNLSDKIGSVRSWEDAIETEHSVQGSGDPTGYEEQIPKVRK